MSRLCQNINCNNNISAQITCHLNRYRTGQSPINIFFITNTGRNKHARNRCRCAYCLSGISIVKYSTGTLFEFSGYCIKVFSFFQRYVINLLVNIVFNFLAIKKPFISRVISRTSVAFILRAILRSSFADFPLAYIEPTILPALVPTIKSGRIPCCSRTSITLCAHSPGHRRYPRPKPQLAAALVF